MDDAREAIISIHRGYADAILAGTKTVELRRRLPALLPETRLWIYATKPVGAVIGFATVLELDKATPATIWRRYRSDAGVDYSSFKEYFNGTHEAVAILLSAVKRIKPIDISQLRQVRKSFHPPQVLTRLTARESKLLHKISGI